ncbi:MAG: response regulator [Alphaproteobacteria bacterium]
MEQKKILVVEDNNFVRMQICRFLEDEGFETIESTDGQQALEVIADGGVGMAVVDVRMEPMNGFEFVRIIRGEGNKTPVLIITGDENADILSETSRLEIMAVLKKPVQKERLIKSVLRILNVEK